MKACVGLWCLPYLVQIKLEEWALQVFPEEVRFLIKAIIEAFPFRTKHRAWFSMLPYTWSLLIILFAFKFTWFVFNLVSKTRQQRHFVASHNILIQICMQVLRLGNIVELHLDHNLIEAIPNEIVRLRKLQQLTMVQFLTIIACITLTSSLIYRCSRFRIGSRGFAITYFSSPCWKCSKLITIL